MAKKRSTDKRPIEIAKHALLTIATFSPQSQGELRLNQLAARALYKILEIENGEGTHTITEH